MNTSTDTGMNTSMDTGTALAPEDDLGVDPGFGFGAADTPDPAADAALLDQFVRGDPEGRYDAMIQAIRRYRSVAERAAWRVVRDWDTAEDVAQTVCFAFADGYETVSVTGTLRSYFHCAGRTRALNHIRAEQRAHKWTTAASQHLTCAENDALERLETLDLAATLRQWLADMPPRRREAICTRLRLGCTYQEAAEILGLSVGTFGNHVYRATDDLRRHLARAYPPGERSPHFNTLLGEALWLITQELNDV